MTVTLTGTNGSGPDGDRSCDDRAAAHYLFTEAPGTYTVTVDATNFTGSGALVGYTPTPTLRGATRAGQQPQPERTTPGRSPPAAPIRPSTSATTSRSPSATSSGPTPTPTASRTAGEPGINGVTLTLTGTTGTGDGGHRPRHHRGSGITCSPRRPGTYTVDRRRDQLHGRPPWSVTRPRRHCGGQHATR